MLDARHDEKQHFSAKKRIETPEGNVVNMTMHFTAFDVEDAKRFLKENGYDGYELVDE